MQTESTWRLHWNEALKPRRGRHRRVYPVKVWAFAEANPFSDSSGNWSLGVEQAASVLDSISVSQSAGSVEQRDAAHSDIPSTLRPLVVTDPPYYDNIGYAALSDFFYVWLRR